jgi:endonuclease/exonuclease/phosphatase family metal-dependent hydrolase
VRRAFRILTYNVHSCVGADGRHAPERIAQVIEAARVDVAALQEVDAAGRFGIDQPRWLAERLGMSCAFVAARPSAAGAYGNALLSRLPFELIRHGALPCPPGRETRAAQRVRLALAGHTIDILNTHLGLGRGERLGQATCLAGDDWRGGAEHSILCGDLNALPRSRVLRLLGQGLRDTARVAARPRATFPSRFPLLRLDYVLASSSLCVLHVETPTDPRVRIASDHRPVIAELAIAH